ncbi:glutamyl aminopeptidase [Erpetoichthys calabaricus]|uniref:glutamyl aminopeptidase n=1 Tax=Erpetoichthys calabaricus TaxID=27687 RepID=UPI00223496EA|nr:glutamyl aminopeptidase [Erpetoichthys calabaricus]
MQGMDYDERDEKKYCMRTKHVAVICGLVVVVALAVGLGVGLSRPEPCKTQEDLQTTKVPQTTSTPSSSTTQPGNGSPCQASSDESGDWKNFRLPDYMVPVHYDLEMKPDLVKNMYTGTTTIHLTVSKTTKHLWMHIRETFVTELPRLQQQSGDELQLIGVLRCFEFKKHEYLVVEAERPLAPGDYQLKLNFQGSLSGSLVGFYKTTYVENGIVKSIAATDHEPTDARKSFPCFDEPNKKATYSISIIHDSSYHALSNMPVETTMAVAENLNRTVFSKSVKMSTYLVCFAVHQFTFIERMSSRGTRLRIYVQPEQKHTAEYAANITEVVFNYFEEYFNMSYSLPKLDKIAIPDFGTGAMENWGLITYRENNLLYDPEESSSINKQRVASVIAHELVHQWFGNIVTMDWWDDLWLNEGFASFFEYIGVNEAEPDWGMMNIMLIDDVLPVMTDDALLSSHPIIVDVSTPAEITSVFDGISYSKGASILRMLQDWMSPEKFQEGCQEYLKFYQFMNAKTSDFWMKLEEVSNKPVQTVMDTWTSKMGYPVLQMKENSSMIQERFLLDPSASSSLDPSERNYKWNIPIQWYVLGSLKTGTDLYNVSHTSDFFLSNYSLSDGPLKVNRDHLGFFRVNYVDDGWDDIGQQLLSNHEDFSVSDRAGLIDDAFSLARAEILNYGKALNLTLYLQSESSYIVWQRVSSAIAYIRDMLSSDATLHPKFQAYFQDQVKDHADRLGWEDTGTHLERLLRETILGIACQMGHQSALGNASILFHEWMAGKRVPVNLRLLVYRYGMQNSGNETSWNKMFEEYTQTNLAQEKEKLLYGLASVQNITLLDRFLKAIKDESIVRSQDVFTIIRYVSYNQYGETMAWDWTQLNWDYLVKRFTLNDRNLGRLITRITTRFNTELHLWKMENFFETYPEAGAGEGPRKQALESVRNNIRWLASNKNEIQAWLESRGP